MRVTDSFRFQVYTDTLSSLKEKMDQSTQEISSGKRVLVPSDDPAAFSQNMEIMAEQSQNTQYKGNLNALQTQGGYYQTSVDTISNILTSVKQLAVQMSSSTVDANSRSAAATQIGDYIQQLAAVANTKVGNTYIFGGTQSSSPPYAQYTANGTWPSNVNQVAVDGSTTVDAGISAQSVFTGSVNGTNVDIFATLSQFQNDLANNDTTAIQADSNNIDACVDLTANNLSSVGTYNQNITNLLTANNTRDTTLTQASSNLVDVDVAKAVSDYATLSTAYQSALYTMAKVESLSIVNYMPA